MQNKILSTYGKDIEGVKIIPQHKILDERGGVLHMLKNTDEIFIDFGEIYFSFAYPRCIKAWHIHKKMYLNNCVVSGNIKLVLYDMRDNSKTKNNLLEIFIGSNNHCTVQIPPGIANGYTPLGQDTAIIANCATIPHDPNEIIYIDPFNNEIPYNWDIKHK